jgi:hypothetical protein
MQPGALPDPGVIFDSIMARKPENRENHPNKISSVLFYLASIISKSLYHALFDPYILFSIAPQELLLLYFYDFTTDCSSP